MVSFLPLSSFGFVRGGFAHVVELSPFSSLVLYFCFYVCMVRFRFDVRIWYASSPRLSCCDFAFLKLISILFIYFYFYFYFSLFWRVLLCCVSHLDPPLFSVKP